MRSMRVVCSKLSDNGQRIEIVREITNDDGTVEYNGLSVPTDRLEWISAEYEIDDPDELVEIAIYESLMPTDDKHPDAQAARLQKRARLANVKQQLGPMLAPNNKANIKNRLQTAGIPADYVNAVDDDPVAVIKRHSKIDPNVLQKKREFMRGLRRGDPVSMQPTPVSPKSQQVRNRIVPKPEVKLPKVELSGGKRVKHE